MSVPTMRPLLSTETGATKPALKSTSVWGGIGSIAASLAAAYAWYQTPEGQETASNLMLLVSALSGGGGLMAVIGRITAKYRIS
jgi:hypothetical protein